MRYSKGEVTILAGIGIFLVGAASLVVVEVHNLWPAREEQKFKEINCTIATGDMDAKQKCRKHDDKSYPCLRVYVLCGNESKSDGLLQSKKAKPRLLSKDFYNLHQQCTYEPEECMKKTEAKPHLLQSFQSGNPIGTPLLCYYNPKDPDQIVRQKASKESYNKLVLTHMAWPLGIVMLGILVVLLAGCFVSSWRSRNGYERITDETLNVKPLQQTL